MFNSLSSIQQSLEARPADQVFTLEEWSQIIVLNNKSAALSQAQLVFILSYQTLIPQAKVEVLLNQAKQDKTASASLKKWTRIQKTAQDSAVEKLQKKAIFKQLPMDSLLNSRQDWLALSKKLQNSEHITYPALIDALAEIKGQRFNDILALLKKPSPERKAKRLSETKLEAFDEEEHRLSQRRHKRSTFEENRLIFSPENKSNVYMEDAIGATGARIAHLSPEKKTTINTQPHLFTTPGGNKARAVFQIPGQGIVAKHLTPQANLAQANPNREEPILGRQLVFMDIDEIKIYEMTISKADIIAQQEARRVKSQNQLMGASCHTLFKDASSPKPKHRLYHWSHLIAHFLGGPTSPKNLIPATAAANYNILDVLERYVAEKLMKDEVKTLHMHATAKYEDEAPVPTHLIFVLSYTPSNAEGQAIPITETYNLNPRSHTRISEDELKTLGVIRNFTSTLATIEDDVSDSIKPKPPI